MKTAADVLEVSRSSLQGRVNGSAKPRPNKKLGDHKAQDAVVLPRIQALVATRPTYGDRRITALLNRQLRSEGRAAINHKRVYRIMDLLLQRSGFDRPARNHDGKVIMMRSNLRWCNDGLAFACWNGDVIRLGFPQAAHDREIISWRAVAHAGISGSEVRDMLLEAVTRRFSTHRAPAPPRTQASSRNSLG